MKVATYILVILFVLPFSVQVAAPNDVTSSSPTSNRRRKHWRKIRNEKTRKSAMPP